MLEELFAEDKVHCPHSGSGYTAEGGLGAKGSSEAVEKQATVAGEDGVGEGELAHRDFEAAAQRSGAGDLGGGAQRGGVWDSEDAALPAKGVRALKQVLAALTERAQLVHREAGLLRGKVGPAHGKAPRARGVLEGDGGARLGQQQARRSHAGDDFARAIHQRLIAPHPALHQRSTATMATMVMSSSVAMIGIAVFCVRASKMTRVNQLRAAISE